MRIALTSDLHLGLTQPRTIEKMVQRLARAHAANTYDLILLLGDFSGGGSRGLDTHGGGGHYLASCLRLFRKELPGLKMAGCMGNHDLWVYKGNEDKFHENIKNIVQAFNETDVHFFDYDGPLVIGGRTFIGHTLWYGEPYPPTNDANFLPKTIDGQQPHYWLASKASKAVDAMLPLSGNTDTYFCSHFPVVNVFAERDLAFSASQQLGQILIYHGVKGFFNGHSHRKADGVIVAGSAARQWVCASDYYKPAVLTVEL